MKFWNDKTFIIAEISANHGQKLSRALALIKKAKECGVDAVKFQAYTPDSLTIDVDNTYFKIKHGRWSGQTLYELYKKAYTPLKWFGRLKRYAEDLGLVFFATAYDKEGVDFLEDIGVPIHKIASFEIVDLPLIEYMAKTRKPIMISTGMADFREIKEAFNTAVKAGAKEVALLKCVSSYPAKPKEMNLNTIPDMKKKFHCSVGLSDHTLGIGASVTSVTLGANIIEKHFTLSRKDKTIDNFFAAEPNDLKNLVKTVRAKNIRADKKYLGRICYKPGKREEKNRIFRRSLFAVQDIKKGEKFTEKNARSIRPAYGLPPKLLKNILGKPAKMAIKRGTPITRERI